MRRSLGLVMAFGVACAKPDADPSPSTNADGRIEVGLPAPAYAATGMGGDSVSLAALRARDKVVLLNVWATWCGPCRKEIPELRALHESFGGRGLELVGVSVDANGTDDAVRSFVKEFRMDYPIWRDPDERVSAVFRMSGVPATFLIDREGIVRWKATGAIQPGDTTLTAAIERAIRGD